MLRQRHVEPGVHHSDQRVEAAKRHDFDQSLNAEAPDDLVLKRGWNSAARESAIHRSCDNVEWRRNVHGACGDRVDDSLGQTGALRGADVVRPFEGHARALCRRQHDELVDVARKRPLEFVVVPQLLDEARETRVIQQGNVWAEMIDPLGFAPSRMSS